VNILFAGTPDFAAIHLQALVDSRHVITGVISQPDKPGKRGKQKRPSPVKQLAVQYHLPLFQPHKLSAELLSANPVDLLVVVAYGQILDQSILDLPRYGAINVHGSLLPRWRGAAPVQRAIMAGDQKTGVSIMAMDAGLDTGPVYQTSVVNIDRKETAATLLSKLAEVGTVSLLRTLDQLETQSAQLKTQTVTGLTYAKKINKAETRLNWYDSAVNLERIIRALNPEPITFSILEDLRIRIWEAEVDTGHQPTEADASSTPGTIIAATKQGLTIACGTGNLKITGLQIPGGKGTLVRGPQIRNARARLFKTGNQFQTLSHA
jgi:methionyl-tRNA formyltransferase